MQQAQSWLSPQQYLATERGAATRSEYYNGQVYTMAGASPRHTLVAANVIASLGLRFRGRPCTVHTGDLRIKVSPTGLYTYPDVVVVCGQPKFDDAQKDTLLNPALIVEVLSESTEAYDRGRKFDHYRRIESLTDYLLVAQDAALIEHRSRQSADQWLVGFYMGMETVVPLPGLDCALPLAEAYDKVDWPDEDAARGWLRAVKEPHEEYAVERSGPN